MGITIAGLGGLFKTKFTVLLAVLLALLLATTAAMSDAGMIVDYVDEDEIQAIDLAMAAAGALGGPGDGGGAAPDIEDIAERLPPEQVQRKRGRSSVYVTELTSQLWCERQLDCEQPPIEKY